MKLKNSINLHLHLTPNNNLICFLFFQIMATRINDNELSPLQEVKEIIQSLQEMAPACRYRSKEDIENAVAALTYAKEMVFYLTQVRLLSREKNKIFLSIFFQFSWFFFFSKKPSRLIF